ncbi:MAG: 1-acyl-sn-glycerol-3-phosphate acyltransferase, partial [Desulfobacterales bacterium]|nr:1-acyl-sn-glycerol-3-phosphate acyltransferase [Desulfobacterales bacterium]
TLLKDPTKTFVETSEPVNLKEFTELPENKDRTIELQTLILRRNLLLQINRHCQSITGPALKTQQELKEEILTNNRLQSFMQQYSKKRKISIRKIHKQADAYLEEIAANYNSAIVSVSILGVKYIIKSLFEGIMVSEDMLKQVKNAAQKAPVIFMPCHKSHIDYLILPYVLYNNNMPCPHAVAGKNLFFWPLATLLRGGGAFSVRRSFRGAVFYAKVFSEYIYKLLEEGFNIEVFFEGGRSRTGKLLMPQLGFFNILLDAYKEGACDDLIFVPIYIGYDRVLEESSYVHELEGGQKEPESLFQILKAVRLIKRKYGKIYINFHEPISLSDQMAEYGKQLKEMSSKEQNTFCRNLGYKFLYAIDKVTIVNPQSLVASAILNCSKTIFSYTRMLAYIETYIHYLTYQKANMADTLTAGYTQAVKRAIDSYVERKFIEPILDKNQPSVLEYYSVNLNKRTGLEYYKNNAISFFVPAAFTAVTILNMKSKEFTVSNLLEEYTFLRKMFIKEFAYDAEKEPDFFIQNNIEAFMNQGIITAIETQPDTYTVTSAGIERLRHFSDFLKTYFESYQIALKFFADNPKNTIIAIIDRPKKILAIGNRMYKAGKIERYESLSKINFENAVSFFISHSVKGSESKDNIEYYSNTIQKYLKLLSQ